MGGCHKARLFKLRPAGDLQLLVVWASNCFEFAYVMIADDDDSFAGHESVGVKN